MSYRIGSYTIIEGRGLSMKKKFVPSETEFIIFEKESVITTSECDFDCESNCSCYGCVGVCTWKCQADDSTCTTGDFH